MTGRKNLFILITIIEQIVHVSYNVIHFFPDRFSITFRFGRRESVPQFILISQGIARLITLPQNIDKTITQIPGI